MPFSLAFHLGVAEAVDRVRQRLSPRRLPETLYHYTPQDGALGIINSRVLWATCVEDLDDASEILHGVELVKREIQRWQGQHLSKLAEQVLRLLPDMLIDRRPWTFVACFRPTLEKKERGPYCLEFETLSTWEPRLRLSGLAGHARYRRVFYKLSKKRRAIRKAIKSVVTMAGRNRQGELQGPWAESIAELHARSAAQSLMNLIASFKCCIYKWEDEWRIVCSPRYAPNLAPDLDDDAFRPLIKTGEQEACRIGTSALSARPDRRVSEQRDAFPPDSPSVRR